MITRSELIETALRLGPPYADARAPGVVAIPLSARTALEPRHEVRLGTRWPPSRFRRKAGRDLKGDREPRGCEGQAPETIALVHETPEVAACADIALPRELDPRRVVELRVLRGNW